MKIRRNSIMVFQLILAVLVSAGASAATFTSSLPLSPTELVVPFGETVTVTLPGGFLNLPELPDNEYYGEVSYEYHWGVPEGPSGDGLTATIPSSASGSAGVISSPGNYAVVFSGKATYTVRWMEGDVEHSDGPYEVDLTASEGGRLTITFWLVATERIEITGSGASGIVSDQTSNMLRGTKYSFKAHRTPANSPCWPSGYPVWFSSGVGISTSGDECVGTFYSGGDGKTLTVSCGSNSKTASFNSVTPQIQRLEFHWDTQGIDIYDKEDKWQADIGNLSAVNDPACYVQGQKSKARLKFYADKNLTFPVTVSIRGDVHGLDEYITGEDYGRDTMILGTDWSNTGIIESEANAESKVKDDYDVDISWRYKVRSPNGSDEWIDAGDTDNLRYYLVWAQPQFPQEQPWNRVLEMAVDWAEGDESAEGALGHITEEIYDSGFVYETSQGASSFIVNVGSLSYFKLQICLANWGTGTVNCSDVANMACIFGNALGIGNKLTRIRRQHYDNETGCYINGYLLNYIKAIGCSWTNNPFNQTPRVGFSYHHVSSIGNTIYDPCLMLDGDSEPAQTPCSGLLPKGISFYLYVHQLIAPENLNYLVVTNEAPCSVVPMSYSIIQ